MERFDGAAAWAALDEETRKAVGALVLEWVVAYAGEDATGPADEESWPRHRMFAHGAPVLLDMLISAASEALAPSCPALTDDKREFPVPSLLGPVCRVCGCTEYDACPGGCGWAEPDLCTSCQDTPA